MTTPSPRVTPKWLDGPKYTSEGDDGSPRFGFDSRGLANPWGYVVCCVGVGEGGSKTAATINMIPEGLLTRHPEYYPVFTAMFDTNAQVLQILNDEFWRSEPRPRVIIVAAELENPVPSARVSAQIGVGGNIVYGHDLFERFLGLPADMMQEVIKDLDWDIAYFRQTNRMFLLTIAATRGGTGSSGAPFIPRFFKEKMDIEPSLWLNVSIIPTEAEQRAKGGTFPGQALVSFFYMQRDQPPWRPVDGVILVSNESLYETFGCDGYQQANYLFHEMLAPLMLTPVGRYSVTDIGSQIDVNDIFRKLGKSSFCVLGYSEAVRGGARIEGESDLAFRFEWPLSPDEDLLSLLDDMVTAAMHNTTANYNFHSEAPERTQFLVLVTAPPEFYTQLGQANAKSAVSDVIYDAIQSAAGQISRRGTQISLTVDIGFLKFEAADAVKVTILLADVASEELDDLFIKALGLEEFVARGGEAWAVLQNLNDHEDRIKELMQGLI